MLASRAALELVPRGVRILVASTEMGQGARTTLAQIVAETLGLPLERVLVATPDTATVPDSGPTVASRTCMVVGGLLKACAGELLEKLGGLTPSAYLRRHGPLRVTAAVRAAAGRRLGRRDLPRRRLRHLRLGLRRGRGGEGPRHVRGAADAGDRGGRDRPRRSTR